MRQQTSSIGPLIQVLTTFRGRALLYLVQIQWAQQRSFAFKFASWQCLHITLPFSRTAELILAAIHFVNNRIIGQSFRLQLTLRLIDINGAARDEVVVEVLVGVRLDSAAPVFSLVRPPHRAARLVAYLQLSEGLLQNARLDYRAMVLHVDRWQLYEAAFVFVSGCLRDL